MNKLRNYMTLGIYRHKDQGVYKTKIVVKENDMILNRHPSIF